MFSSRSMLTPAAAISRCQRQQHRLVLRIGTSACFCCGPQATFLTATVLTCLFADTAWLLYKVVERTKAPNTSVVLSVRPNLVLTKSAMPFVDPSFPCSVARHFRFTTACVTTTVANSCACEYSIICGGRLHGSAREKDG